MEQDSDSLPGGGFEDEAPAEASQSVERSEGESVIAPYRAAELATKRLWVWSGGLLAAVVAAAVIGGLVLKVPYVALVPGSAKDTEPLLSVSGADEFPSDGQLLFTPSESARDRTCGNTSG